MLTFLILKKYFLKMHTFNLLIIYYVLIFIWITVQTNFLFTFIIIAIINRLFFHVVIIILGSNDLGAEGAKALAEGLKINNNLANLNFCIVLYYLHK